MNEIMGQHLGYVRVSTVYQNAERQLSGLELDKIFEDKCSGKDRDRPALTQLIEYAREGDTIHVQDISRMARNTEDLLSLVKLFNGKGITIIFHNENFVFNGKQNPIQELMLTMLGAIYQFERSMLLERQREGIALAKEAGKYSGRKQTIDTAKFKEMVERGLKPVEIQRELGISKSSFYRIKNDKGL